VVLTSAEGQNEGQALGWLTSAAPSEWRRLPLLRWVWQRARGHESARSQMCAIAASIAGHDAPTCNEVTVGCDSASVAVARARQGAVGLPRGRRRIENSLPPSAPDSARHRSRFSPPSRTSRVSRPGRAHGTGPVVSEKRDNPDSAPWPLHRTYLFTAHRGQRTWAHPCQRGGASHPNDTRRYSRCGPSQ
jgi:hypothetical protein